MESMQQRCLHKLYGCKAILGGRIAALDGIPNRTTFATEEMDRCIGAKAHIDDAIYLLLGDPEVDPEFQVELPF